MAKKIVDPQLAGALRANPLRRIAKAIATNAVFSNKLNRQFAVSRPGLHLLTDISYIK